MLYKIDYTSRGAGRETVESKWVNFCADQTEAVKAFMGWFFRCNPEARVKLTGVTEVEIIGDMSGLDFIDELAKEKAQ